MYSIYMIENTINHKKYIGKTLLDINKRFYFHKKDSTKDKYKNRPLYRAFKKYGENNFIILEIEKTTKPNIREKFWISYYNTYNSGYNATIGGDGKQRLNHQKIIKTYLSIQNMTKTASIIGCSVDAVRNILRKNNIIIKSSSDIVKEDRNKQIIQYDLKHNLINKFDNSICAENFINIKGSNSHIRACANGNRKTAYGYIWKFI